MNKVTILVPAPHCRIDVIKAGIIGGEPLARFWNEDRDANYVELGSFYTDEFGESAAEEAFDLSNNPSRQDERMLVQGRTESLSVGGVVKLEVKSDTGCISTAYYLCENVGWEVLS